MKKYLVKGIFRHSETLQLHQPGEIYEFDAEEAIRINDALKDVYPVTLEEVQENKPEKVKKPVKEEVKEG